MGCKYHEERYKEEGYVNRSDMAEKLLEQLEAIGIEINKGGLSLPAHKSSINPSKKVFVINEPCAGCAVLHILHAMAILNTDAELNGIPTIYETDNGAYYISQKLGLNIDKEEWLNWSAAKKANDEIVAYLDDSDQIWKRREQSMRETIVISGFPGVGKSYFFDLSCAGRAQLKGLGHPDSSIIKVLDSDSSQFSWHCPNGEGQSKGRHPEFPENYIKHIKDNIGVVDIILVSSHDLVRQALVNAGIEFYLVFAGMDTKEEYLKRYEGRGSEASFVELLDKNWNQWIGECLDYGCAPGVKLVALNKGQYLTDLLKDYPQEHIDDAILRLAGVSTSDLPPEFVSAAMVGEPTDPACEILEHSNAYKKAALVIDEMNKQGIQVEMEDSREAVAEKVLEMTANLIEQRNLYSMLLDGAICEHGKDNKLELGVFAYNAGDSCELTFTRSKQEDGTCMMSISRKVIHNEN